MPQFKSASTCTISEAPKPARRDHVRRVRLTLHAEGKGSPAPRRNEPLHNGFDSDSVSLPKDPVFGVVQRVETSKAEVVVYEWSINQLREEMKYIKEVRQSLEQIRQQMFGEFRGMKAQIQQLTEEVKASEARQESIQKEVSTNTSALHQYGKMNSSLTTLTIDLQRSLLDSAMDSSERQEKMRDLQTSYHQSLQLLKEKDHQIQDAQMENQILNLKVESSQEANASAMRDMTRKLYNQYEDKLKEAECKHQAEREALQARINQALQELKEANQKILEAEQKIAERDQRIQEMDQFIARMLEERHLLQQRLQEQEEQLRQLRQRDEPDARSNERSQRVEEETAGLRERIQHLDNMVQCQQRKVKRMIEEIEILRSKIQHKDAIIEDNVERISFLEAENKELQDKLDYMMSLPNGPRLVQTREQAVSCDISRVTTVTNRQKASTPYMRLMELSLQREIS
ncbi:myocardial zonula adherens protein-like isoform X1 [Narcine bancroftii]|uniref:myocardial zonula adherens protein-like isoform X1 n=1 Tax=Narcine bancroftii TaxID=1343680 RepID=UPI003831059F